MSSWEKHMKIFVSHVNTHQKVTSAEENFNSQMNRMTYSLDTSQPVFPIILVISQWGQEQGAIVTGMEIIHKLNNMHFHSSKTTGLWPLLGAQSANSRDQFWVLNMTASLLVVGLWHWTFSIMEEYEFYSHWNRHLSRQGLLCLDGILLPKLPSTDWQTVFNHHHGI